jgi:hypothetical protein
MMSNAQIIDSFFCEDETINRHNYFEMLKHSFYPIIQKKRLLNRKIIFLQSGTPSHFSQEISAWLDKHFDNRWIDRDDRISWASLFLDLTPLDFF